MDMLSKRYACPFLMLDESINTGSMSEYITEFIGIINQEKEDETLWEYFLYKVYDKSYLEFLNECKTPASSDKPVDFETAINDSMGILDGFVPE